MTKDVIEYLGALPPSAASFLGSFTGACIGLLAVVFGALFNAFLNRRRDDRLRRIERETLRLAFVTEVRSIESTLRRNAQTAIRQPDPKGGTLLIPNITEGHFVLNAARDKLLILDQAHLAEIIHCYLSLASMFDGLSLLADGKSVSTGSTRTLIALPDRHGEAFQKMSRMMADRFKEAREKLEAPRRRNWFRRRNMTAAQKPANDGVELRNSV